MRVGKCFNRGGRIEFDLRQKCPGTSFTGDPGSVSVIWFCNRKVSCKAFSPSDWNNPRFRTSSFAKSHDLVLPVPGASSPETIGRMNRGQSFSQVERNVCIDVEDVDDISES